MDRIETPRGTFKVSGIFKNADEANAAGYGIYFAHEDNDIYIKPSGTLLHGKLFAIVKREQKSR